MLERVALVGIILGGVLPMAGSYLREVSYDRSLTYKCGVVLQALGFALLCVGCTAFVLGGAA